MSPLAELLSIDELYTTGQYVAAGLYRDEEAGREVRLRQPDVLPADMEGRFASYTCSEYTWEPIPSQAPRSILSSAWLEKEEGQNCTTSDVRQERGDKVKKIAFLEQIRLSWYMVARRMRGVS